MKALAACAGLALAAHGLLFWQPLSHQGAGARGGTAAAMQVRMAALTPQAATSPESTPAPVGIDQPADAHADPTPPSAPEHAATDTSTNSAGVPDRFPPLLDVDEMPVSLPDAPMPEGGLTVLAHVSLAADGQVQQVVVGGPAGVPQAFLDVVDVGLKQSHLRPLRDASDGTPAGLAYCVAVRFEPGQGLPQLGWLPGAARDAARCLSTPATAARDIDRR